MPVAFNARKETERLTTWMRAAVLIMLKREGAVVGVSGGVDSATVLHLLVRAIGPERVIAVLLPDSESSPAGTCSTRHLEQNVAAAGIKLSQRDLDQISRSFAYWHLHALFMRGINRVGKHFSPH